MASLSYYNWRVGSYTSQSCNDVCAAAGSTCEVSGLSLFTGASELFAEFGKVVTYSSAISCTGSATPKEPIPSPWLLDVEFPIPCLLPDDETYPWTGGDRCAFVYDPTDTSGGAKPVCPCSAQGVVVDRGSHLRCPYGGLHFDFGGTQEPGGRELYSLLADLVTQTAVNVAFDTHLFVGPSVRKLFTPMTEAFVSVLDQGQREELSVRIGPRDRFPELTFGNGSVVLHSEFHQKYVKVHHAPCHYMQPEQYALSKEGGREYEYAWTSNACTFLTLRLPTLRLRIVAVTAGLEADGVGTWAGASG
eukprot:scaffold1743_cov344-Prasinococcus_capsulatus_cf.AAC.3